MKLAVISDIHDNLVNLEKCLNWCGEEKIKHLICCGDVTNSETLNFLALKFGGSIYLVKGNLEIYEEEEVKEYGGIQYFGRLGQVELAGKIMCFCHEPYLIDKVLEKCKCDIVFCGHTHEPWISERNGVKLVNVGTLGGVFQKATFAAWNTEQDEPELKILEDI